jgi:hypothetical protein
MVTNYPQWLTAARAERAGAGNALLSRAFTRLGRVLCGLRGHENLMHFEGNRVMMRCTGCGHDTPGWEIGGRGPRKRFEGDPRRHALASQPRLVLRKSA